MQGFLYIKVDNDMKFSLPNPSLCFAITLLGALSLPAFANTNQPPINPLSLGDAQHQGTFTLHQHQSIDGVSRPFVIYTPSNAATESPLIVYLHGAISRESLSADPIASAKRSQIIQLAEHTGSHILFPFGQKTATWFDSVGTQMVLDEIQWAIAHLNIHPDKVFLSGFSDGGSGVWYFASTQADQFAGFLSFNGSPAVASHLGQQPFYVDNMNQKPLLAINTRTDALYPSQMMTPLMTWLMQKQPQINYHTPSGRHEMSYLPTLLDTISHFVAQHTNSPSKQISLEASDLSVASYDWLSIKAFDFQQPQASWHTSDQFTMHNDKATLGVQPDTAHQGAHLKVAKVNPNSTAQTLGITTNDLITHIDGIAITNLYQLFDYLATKKAKDAVSVSLIRDNQNLQLDGYFNPGYDYQVFEKHPPSGKILAQLLDDRIEVQTSRIKHFVIDFDRLPIDTKDAFLVIINDIPHQIIPSGKQDFIVPQPSPKH